MRFAWDIHYATDKDTLMAGELRAGTQRIIVDADDLNDSRLMAEQMIAARGFEPTDADLIDWPEQ